MLTLVGGRIEYLQPIGEYTESNTTNFDNNEKIGFDLTRMSRLLPQDYHLVCI